MGARVTVVGKKTDNMLTVKEAAIMTGAGVSTVTRWIATGRLPACKVRGSKAYYIPVDNLNEFEKNGNIRKYNRKHKEPLTAVDILETMSDRQQELLLEAYAATAKLLSMTENEDQLGMIKATLNALLWNDGTLRDLLTIAPNLLEVLPA